MKILLVEDDELKRRRVVEFLHEVDQEISVREARSLRSGLREILAEGWNLILLDMSMPAFDITIGEDGGRPQAYAGRELLNHMRRRQLDMPTCVLTQFDRFGEAPDLLTLEQLDNELKRDHPTRYVGAIYYSVMEERWKTELGELIRRLLSLS
jgi:CheY-like chemotaxis protein